MKLRPPDAASLLILVALATHYAGSCDVIPTPTPTPTPGPMAVAFVVETSQPLTANQVLLVNGVTMRDWLKGRGHAVQRLDPNDKPTSDWQWALDVGAGRKPPWLALRDKAGKTTAFDLPADIAVAQALLAKQGG